MLLMGLIGISAPYSQIKDVRKALQTVSRRESPNDCPL